MDRKYHVEFSITAEKDIKKMNKRAVRLVLSWLLKNIENTDNPRKRGKALIDKSDIGSLDLKNKWRYRIGDVRVICDINDEIVRVLVVKIDHRRKVYL